MDNKGVEVDRTGPFDRLTRPAAIVITLVAVILFFVFQRALGPSRARVASICTAMILTVIWMRWDLKGRVWFWLLAVFLTLLQVPLVLLPVWNNKDYPGVVLLPGALLDMATIYFLIGVAEKVITKIDTGRL